MLNKWKKDHNLDEVEVREVPALALLVLVIYGERPDVDMAGARLHKEFTERQTMKRPIERVDTGAEENGGQSRGYDVGA